MYPSHNFIGLFFFLALPLQFVVQVSVMSFKVLFRELYFGEVRCRNSSVVVMLFSSVFQSLLIQMCWV